MGRHDDPQTVLTVTHDRRVGEAARPIVAMGLGRFGCGAAESRGAVIAAVAEER